MVTFKSYAKQITMRYTNKVGYKGYVRVVVGNYLVDIKKIQTSRKSESMTQPYGDLPLRQDIGKQPRGAAITCVIRGVSTKSDLINFVNTLNKPFKYVHNLFLPGEILKVTNNDGIIKELDLNTMWRVDIFTIEQVNVDRFVINLQLLRDAKLEGETWP